MNVVFRVDASIQIGSGHVMRCLTLAGALQQHGLFCQFVCRELNGHLSDYITSLGFSVKRLPSDISDEITDAQHSLAQLTGYVQLLVVDHYQLGATFCLAMRPRCQYIMVIDDLANRPHHCDVLLDQNLLPQPEQRYVNLVPAGTQQLLGPRYALLRSAFYQTTSRNNPSHILVGFGGSDEENLTTLAITAIQSLKSFDVTADIVIGANNPWQAMLAAQISTAPNLTLHVQTSAMATLMSQATLMLGTGGSTHWERCIVGLPGLVVTIADNQLDTTAYLQTLGACVWLGSAQSVSAHRFAEQLAYYLQRPAQLAEIRQRAMALVPKHAGTPLVVEHLLALLTGTS